MVTILLSLLATVGSWKGRATSYPGRFGTSSSRPSCSIPRADRDRPIPQRDDAKRNHDLNKGGKRWHFLFSSARRVQDRGSLLIHEGSEELARGVAAEADVCRAMRLGQEPFNRDFGDRTRPWDRVRTTIRKEGAPWNGSSSWWRFPSPTWTTRRPPTPRG